MTRRCWTGPVLGLVLTALVSAGVLEASGATNEPPAAPLVPTPGRVNPRELPTGFSRPAPESIAELKAMEQQVKTLVARVSPAVVGVEVGSSSGSGVIISGDGLVLSAGHVCGGPNRAVHFTFPDGRTAEGYTLGVNAEDDTGLMRITNRVSCPHVPVGESSQTHVGDWVLALGHPGGFDVRRSLVVRLGRVIWITESALQTDCTISPGDSGGPVFDMFGRVVAIHSAISESTAENFHVPITQFLRDWTELATGKSTRLAPPSPARAYAGMDAETTPGGCRITSLEPGGPASGAGLKIGDLVQKVEGREILSASSLRRWVAEADPGETLQLEVLREGRVVTLRLRLAAPPPR